MSFAGPARRGPVPALGGEPRAPRRSAPPARPARASFHHGIPSPPREGRPSAARCIAARRGRARLPGRARYCASPGDRGATLVETQRAARASILACARAERARGPRACARAARRRSGTRTARRRPRRPARTRPRRRDDDYPRRTSARSSRSSRHAATLQDELAARRAAARADRAHARAKLEPRAASATPARARACASERAFADADGARDAQAREKALHDERGCSCRARRRLVLEGQDRAALFAWDTTAACATRSGGRTRAALLRARAFKKTLRAWIRHTAHRARGDHRHHERLPVRRRGVPRRREAPPRRCARSSEASTRRSRTAGGATRRRGEINGLVKREPTRMCIGVAGGSRRRSARRSASACARGLAAPEAAGPARAAAGAPGLSPSRAGARARAPPSTP